MQIVGAEGETTKAFKQNVFAQSFAQSSSQHLMTHHSAGFCMGHRKKCQDVIHAYATSMDPHLIGVGADN